MRTPDPNRLIKTLGSLPVAVFLISAFAGILITSTVMESVHGTPFAQEHFYEAVWFRVFLAGVWINIFCATLSRRPFKKRHTGFIVTHIGILTLLIGTLLTLLFGREGQLTLLEGERWDRLQQKSSDLLASPQQGPAYQFHLPEKAPDHVQRLKVPGSDLKLFFHRLASNAGSQMIVKDGSEFFNPAVQFTLDSRRAGVRKQVWLVARDEQNPFSDELELGPATFRLEDADEADAARAQEQAAADSPDAKSAGHSGAGTVQGPDPARLVLYRQDGQPLDTIDLPSHSKKILDAVSIDGGAFTLHHVRFLPYARVDKDKLVDDRASGKWNPAVEFTITDREGREERHTRFALFPDFDSLHGKETPNIFNLRVELRAPAPQDTAAKTPQPGLVFGARENGDWSWKSTRSDGTSRSGVVKQGETFETGWMDMKVTVDRVVRRAVTSHVTAELPAGSDEAEAGCEVSYVDADGKERHDWVLVSRPLEIQTPAGKWTLSVIDRSLQLPFMLQLKDFRKIDYPGTTNPASFESDVTLVDQAKGVKIDRTIKMNEPLDYAGWRIFQSSYLQDPQYGEASVFTVAKNPGIGLTYAGLLILLIGVVLLFYIQPFSSGDHVH